MELHADDTPAPDEIEITPEMIEAGTEAYWAETENWLGSDRAFIKRIILAALRVKPRGSE